MLHYLLLYVILNKLFRRTILRPLYRKLEFVLNNSTRHISLWKPARVLSNFAVILFMYLFNRPVGFVNSGLLFCDLDASH